MLLLESPPTSGNSRLSWAMPRSGRRAQPPSTWLRERNSNAVRSAPFPRAHADAKPDCSSWTYIRGSPAEMPTRTLFCRASCAGCIRHTDGRAGGPRMLRHRPGVIVTTSHETAGDTTRANGRREGAKRSSRIELAMAVYTTAGPCRSTSARKCGPRSIRPRYY